jgi:tripartite-type tricarboxylate transporter receptor subunit TctC
MKMFRRQFLHFAAVAMAAAVLPPAAWAQSYPSRPVRVIVPVAAGGANDVTACMIAQKLSDKWGRQVYIDNVPGGAENIGIGAAARAPADGYTILFAAGGFTANTSMYSKIPYDPVQDFAPISLVASGPHVLTVHPSVKANTVQELVALLKANPGQYSFASSGASSQPRLVGEMFKLKFGVDLVHVPFNGGGPAIASTIGGHTPIAFTSLSNAATNIKDGKLRALGVTSARRLAEFPDVPTMVEAGVSDMVSGSMQGILAPANTPKDIIDLWHREVASIVALPDVRERLISFGLEPIANSPEEFAAWIKVEIAKWGKVVKDANIKVQ